MTKEEIKLINKIWDYSEEELNHRRIYLLVMKIAKEKAIYPEMIQSLTSEEAKELELISTRVSTIPCPEVFRYPNFVNNPYTNDEWWSCRDYIAFYGQYTK